ncbi:hypothetical protein L0F63_006100 [Massospora cicadina]|nr:hypothetical protein L0F63_006100 [Massospora cicadina]
MDSTEIKIPRLEEGDHVGRGSSLGAYFNIVNALAGVGTLGLGNTLADGALSSIYTGTLLVKCMNNLERGYIETYPDVGMTTFGIVGRTVVQFCQYSIISGGVTMYMVYAGTQVHTLVNHTGAEVSRWPFIVAAGFLIWVPLVSFKTIREVAWISALGGLATLLAVVISVVMCFEQLPHQTHSEHILFDFTKFPGGMAIISFAYGGTMIFPHVYRSMKCPKRWNFTVTSAILGVTVLYLVMSAVGYSTFGSKTQNPIFKNLDETTPRWIASLFLACHVLCAGTVFLCSLCLEVERYFKVSVEQMGKVNEAAIRILIRTGVLSTLALIGCVIDEFELIMGLVGAFSECMLVFIVPTVCHLKMFGIKGRAFWEYPVILATLVGAITCVTVGTQQAILDIPDKLRSLIDVPNLHF